jgi:hypothetical protein
VSIWLAEKPGGDNPTRLSHGSPNTVLREMERRTRIIISVIAGVVATVGSFPFLVPAGCSEEAGVPSWEQCTSLLGTPVFSVADFGWDGTLDVIQPILVGFVVGLFVWWITRPS